MRCFGRFLATVTLLQLSVGLLAPDHEELARRRDTAKKDERAPVWVPRRPQNWQDGTFEMGSTTPLADWFTPQEKEYLCEETLFNVAQYNLYPVGQASANVIWSMAQKLLRERMTYDAFMGNPYMCSNSHDFGAKVANAVNAGMLRMEEENTQLLFCKVATGGPPFQRPAAGQFIAKMDGDARTKFVEEVTQLERCLAMSNASLSPPSGKLAAGASLDHNVSSNATVAVGECYNTA